MRHLIDRRLFLAAAAALPMLAAADDYPSRPIKLVVPYAAGGATDQLARQLADKLRARLNQAIVIDNRPGAGTSIASEYVARQPADGYTLYLTSSAMTSAPAMVAKLPYDSVRDFTPVAMLCSMVIGMFASNEVPVPNVTQLISYMRANPGKLNYASNGTGTTSNLAMALFNQRAGVSSVHVPMKGGGQTIPELIANRVQLYFDAMSSSGPMAKAGKIKLLAIGADKRSPTLPDVPTIAESLPGFVYEPWSGIVAPARLPAPITQRLNREIDAVLQDPEMVSSMRAQFLTPAAGKPEMLQQVLAEDVGYWAAAAKAAGVKPE